MNNYIILNGVDSRTIKGLLIQELPPISKPQIRTNIEQIDGRDGDIVTKLGYAAYNKEFTIGLYGDFDINEIINFFDSEGQVTFSNESDKYYNYQILNQVNFERLIRFRTAKVTMHIQPFKYSLQDTPKAFTITNQTQISIINNGNIISKPAITIFGTGTINLYLNGIQLFVINLGDEGYITIDAALMEAYKDTTATLKNRLVSGNYNNFIFNTGTNTISWSGTITEINIANYTRWL